MKSRRIALFGVALLALAFEPRGAATAAAAENEFLDAAAIHALSRNGRVVEQTWEFKGAEKIDTGFSVETCLRFRDEAGRRFYVRERDFPDAKLKPRFIYKLDVRFIGYVRDGAPLAQIGERTLLARADDSKGKPYEGDIRESDPRVPEIRADIIAGKAPPTRIRLRYSGTRGDYLEFYDLMGRRLYFRYREDRFDDLGTRRIRNLIKGQAYEVFGNYAGVIAEAKFIAPGAAGYDEALRDPNSILAFQYSGARPLRLDEVIF